MMRTGVLLAAMLLCGCHAQADKSADNMVAPPVKLYTVGGATEAAVRHFPGVVATTGGSVLAFRLPGQLQQLAVRNGQVVKKGQLLARLDDTDLQNQLLDRQAQFDLANVQFKRAEQMLAKKLIAQASFDEAKARRTQAEAALRLVRDNLSYTRLRAPYDGVIAKRFVDSFQFVQAKEPIFQLQNKQMLDIAIQLPESLMTRVRDNAVNYQPQVRFAGVPGQVFLARYKEHDAVADPATRTFRVVLTMAKPSSLQVLAGMSVDVQVNMHKVFALATQQPLTVPAEAVFQPDGKSGSYVWRYQAGKVVLTPVTLGEVSSSGIAITSGLSHGDVVVAAGASFLREGQAVRPLVKERGL